MRILVHIAVDAIGYFGGTLTQVRLIRNLSHHGRTRKAFNGWPSCLDIASLLLEDQCWIDDMVALAVETAVCFSLILLCRWVQCVLYGSLCSILAVVGRAWLCRIKQGLLVLRVGNVVLSFGAALVDLSFNLYWALSIVSHWLSPLLAWLNLFLLITLEIIVGIGFAILVPFVFVKSTWSSVIHLASRIMIRRMSRRNGTFLSPPPLAQVG